MEHACVDNFFFPPSLFSPLQEYKEGEGGVNMFITELPPEAWDEHVARFPRRQADMISSLTSVRNEEMKKLLSAMMVTASRPPTRRQQELLGGVGRNVGSDNTRDILAALEAKQRPPSVLTTPAASPKPPSPPRPPPRARPRPRQPPGGYYSIDAVTKRIDTSSMVYQRNTAKLASPRRYVNQLIIRNKRVPTKGEIVKRKRMHAKASGKRQEQATVKRLETEKEKDATHLNCLIKKKEKEATRARRREYDEVQKTARDAWRIAMCTVNSVLMWQEALEKRKRPGKWIRTFTFAKIVFRRWLEAKRNAAVSKLCGVLTGSLLFAVTMSIKVKRMRVDKIKLFLTQIHGMSKTVNAILGYKRHVMSCYNVLRSFVIRRQAQLTLLNLKWRKIWARARRHSEPAAPRHYVNTVLSNFLRDRYRLTDMLRAETGKPCLRLPILPSDEKMMKLISQAQSAFRSDTASMRAIRKGKRNKKENNPN
eukprot:TRINITY_DN4020_c1_g1_i1.p1 TRINITY_DN4020_c1_g1~~TRINITY_DN4020_c1_g1_i1.p1  ORF type:complete len:480 (+),score=56.80 TRINITY_DN4020_c1_g1_i1:803-2242(+)